jgi:hypothetical protein
VDLHSEAVAQGPRYRDLCTQGLVSMSAVGGKCQTEVVVGRSNEREKSAWREPSRENAGRAHGSPRQQKKLDAPVMHGSLLELSAPRLPL